MHSPGGPASGRPGPPPAAQLTTLAPASHARPFPGTRSHHRLCLSPYSHLVRPAGQPAPHAVAGQGLEGFASFCAFSAIWRAYSAPRDWGEGLQLPQSAPAAAALFRSLPAAAAALWGIGAAQACQPRLSERWVTAQRASLARALSAAALAVNSLAIKGHLRSPSLGLSWTLTEVATTRAQPASQPSREAMQSFVARRGLAARVSGLPTSVILENPSAVSGLRVLLARSSLPPCRAACGPRSPARRPSPASPAWTRWASLQGNRRLGQAQGWGLGAGADCLPVQCCTAGAHVSHGARPVYQRPLPGDRGPPQGGLLPPPLPAAACPPGACCRSSP